MSDTIIELPKYVPSRPNDLLIINKIHLIEGNILDYHIVAYYLDENRLKLIIRRLDCGTGWNQNLSIQIFSLDQEENEIISIGSSDTNSIIREMNTKIYLEYLMEYEQKIPKIIVQTNQSYETNNILLYNSIMTFIELNPEYEYFLFDANERRSFIEQNFPKEFLDTYDMLNPGA